MHRVGRLLLVCALGLLLPGCLYERAVSESRYTLGVKRCFQGEYAGRFQFTLVRESHKPRGLGRFPDGGTPVDVAAYIEVARLEQSGAAVVGRYEVPLFRRGDLGNLEGNQVECREPNEMHYRVENGYGGDTKVTEGVLRIPPRNSASAPDRRP
ncbi:MAG: hypothetical protein ACOY93_07760 [Bacillota bacterium]